jgi:molybdopterin converting factor subunit 1
MDIRATLADSKTALRTEVRAFARARELLGADTVTLEVPQGTTVAGVMDVLVERVPPLADIAAATRVARNGRIARASDLVEDGDEIALLPPVGGG